MNTPGHELTNNHIRRGQETNQIRTQEAGTHDTHTTEDWHMWPAKNVFGINDVTSFLNILEYKREKAAQTFYWTYLSSTEERKSWSFGATLWWVNDDWILICG